MHARREILQLLLRDLVDVGHGFDAHAGHHLGLESMLEQEGAQPVVHHIVVGGGHRNAFRTHGLQAIDDAVAHRGGGQA